MRSAMCIKGAVRVRNSVNGERLKVCPINIITEDFANTWKTHVDRTDNYQIPKLAYSYKPEARRLNKREKSWNEAP